MTTQSMSVSERIVASYAHPCYIPSRTALSAFITRLGPASVSHHFTNPDAPQARLSTALWRRLCHYWQHEGPSCTDLVNLLTELHDQCLDPDCLTPEQRERLRRGLRPITN